MGKSRGFVTVINDLGLHTRAATVVVKAMQDFQSNIEVHANDVCANAKSIMGLLALGARKGTRLELVVEGNDHDQAYQTLLTLIERGFNE